VITADAAPPRHFVVNFPVLFWILTFASIQKLQCVVRSLVIDH